MSAPADWDISLLRRARKDLAKLAPTDQRRVVAALDRLRRNDPSLDVRRLKNAGAEPQWRIRAGEVRIRLQLDFHTNTALVLRVLPRGRAYER